MKMSESEDQHDGIVNDFSEVLADVIYPKLTEPKEVDNSHSQKKKYIQVIITVVLVIVLVVFGGTAKFYTDHLRLDENYLKNLTTQD